MFTLIIIILLVASWLVYKRLHKPKDDASNQKVVNEQILDESEYLDNLLQSIRKLYLGLENLIIDVDKTYNLSDGAEVDLLGSFKIYMEMMLYKISTADNIVNDEEVKFINSILGINDSDEVVDEFIIKGMEKTEVVDKILNTPLTIMMIASVDRDVALKIIEVMNDIGSTFISIDGNDDLKEITILNEIIETLHHTIENTDESVSFDENEKKDSNVEERYFNTLSNDESKKNILQSTKEIYLDLENIISNLADPDEYEEEVESFNIYLRVMLYKISMADGIIGDEELEFINFVLGDSDNDNATDKFVIQGIVENIELSDAILNNPSILHLILNFNFDKKYALKVIEGINFVGLAFTAIDGHRDEKEINILTEIIEISTQ